MRKHSHCILTGDILCILLTGDKTDTRGFTQHVSTDEDLSSVE